MSVMRGIAFRLTNIALTGLPDDMIIGDPTRLDMRAVEKHAKPVSAFADTPLTAGSSN